MSTNAHGSTGPRLTFSTRRSGSQVRHQRKQKDADSSAQGTQRTKYKKGIAYWYTLTPVEQLDYKTRAKGMNITGFNLFMRDWLNGLITAVYQLLLQTGDHILQQDGYRINLE